MRANDDTIDKQFEKIFGYIEQNMAANRWKHTVHGSCAFLYDVVWRFFLFWEAKDFQIFDILKDFNKKTVF